MTITEFKNIYTEVNPNANAFNYENDAERKFLGVCRIFLLLFFRNFYDV